MNKNTYFFLAIFFSITQSCISQKNLNIGDVWHDSVDNKIKIYVIPPYSFKSRIDFSFNNIDFIGAVDSKDTIIFISTSNPKFKINGRKYIGKEFSSFQEKNKLKKVEGWGSYLPIDTEWYAYFNMDNLADSSRAKFVFKIK